MEKENFIILMEILNMKVIISMIKETEKENYIMQMEIFGMKEIGLMINLKEIRIIDNLIFYI